MPNRESLGVAQVAALCGVSKDTVRRWDREGKLASPRRDALGHRQYDRKAVVAYNMERNKGAVNNENQTKTKKWEI